MSLTASMVEELVAWCAGSEALADIRSKARSDFFGYDEPGTVKYLPQVGEVNARERRFLGWFCFSFRLPDGMHPAEMAAPRCQIRYGDNHHGDGQQGCLSSATREEFEIDSRILSQALHRDDVLCAHIVPVGRSRRLVWAG